MGNYAYMKFIDEKFEFEIEVRALEGFACIKYHKPKILCHYLIIICQYRMN